MQVYKTAFLAMSSFLSDKAPLLTARRWCIAEGSQADSGFMRTFSVLSSQVNHFSPERRTLNELTDRSQQAEVRATYVFPTFTCSNCFLSFQHPSPLLDREFLANFFLWQIFFLPEIGSVFLLAYDAEKDILTRLLDRFSSQSSHQSSLQPSRYHWPYLKR